MPPTGSLKLTPNTMNPVTGRWPSAAGPGNIVPAARFDGWGAARVQAVSTARAVWSLVATLI
jgi:hypothetical protein